MNGILCSKPVNKKYKALLHLGTHGLLDWCHNKVDVLFWISVQKLKAKHMCFDLMEEFRYLDISSLKKKLHSFIKITSMFVDNVMN